MLTIAAHGCPTLPAVWLSKIKKGNPSRKVQLNCEF